jgi:SPP1 gp7 family putative phage head morphogenesis protein
MSVGDELKDTVILARQIIWQYQIADYTDASLKTILGALDQGRKELIDQIGNRDFRFTGVDRADALLEELQDMTLGVRTQLTGSIADAATIAGDASVKEYGDILSFKGKLTDTVGFNFVSVAPEQLKALVQNTPVGGRLLNDWVSRTFESAVAAEIDTAVLTGYLKGEGIEKITNRLVSAFDIIRREAETLTRTYIADANNQAAKAVYDANSDIIDAEEWNATLEINTKAGRGTCLRCAGLDGKIFKLDEPHVRPPIHPNCRCFLTPKTKSYRELGLNIDELKDAARPYTTKDGKKILRAGQFDGNFEDFFNAKGATYQKDLVGPNRLRLMNEGKVKFADLVDDSGNVRLLRKGEDGGYVGLIK